jgi:hypothetical protein
MMHGTWVLAFAPCLPACLSKSERGEPVCKGEIEWKKCLDEMASIGAKPS